MYYYILYVPQIRHEFITSFQKIIQNDNMLWYDVYQAIDTRPQTNREQDEEEEEEEERRRILLKT